MAPRSAADHEAARLIGQAGAHFQAGDHPAAERACRTILALHEAHFDALHLLGVLCSLRGAPAEAIVWLERARSLRPHHPQCLENLGGARLDAGQAQAAIAAFDARLALGAPTPGVLNNLGNALLLAGQPAEAIARYRAALTLAPDFAPARFNLGRGLEETGAFAEAEAALRTVLPAAPPDRVPLIVNQLGRVLCAQGRYREALDLTPADRTTRWNQSLTRLLLGDFAQGWRDYEHRWDVTGHSPPPAGHRVPDLSAIRGKRVRIVAEQGLGDSIQFVRYVPLLADLGAEVWLSVPPPLIWLFRTLRGVRGVVGADDPVPPADLTTSMLSLPLAFGTRLDTIPAATPYLDVPPHARIAWADRIGGCVGARVGVVWAGSTASAPRSAIPAALLAPLLDHQQVTFHCLQRDVTAEDRARMGESGAMVFHDAALHDFADTAALLAAMDLVITIDTSVAHLAGAMGRPTWIMIPFDPDWRWLLGRTDSPWYPSVRLFRQPSPGDWASVVRMVGTALSRRFDTP